MDRKRGGDREKQGRGTERGGREPGEEARGVTGRDREQPLCLGRGGSQAETGSSPSVSGQGSQAETGAPLSGAGGHRQRQGAAPLSGAGGHRQTGRSPSVRGVGGHRQTGSSPSVWGRGVTGREGLPRQGRKPGPVPPHQAVSAWGGAARPETGYGALSLPGQRPVLEAREQRAEKQPQACLHACLPDEAEVQEPGRLGNRWGERKRQAAQEGGHAGEVGGGRCGLYFKATTRWWRGLECGEGPTENKAEPGLTGKTRCH